MKIQKPRNSLKGTLNQYNLAKQQKKELKKSQKQSEYKASYSDSDTGTTTFKQ